MVSPGDCEKADEVEEDEGCVNSNHRDLSVLPHDELELLTVTEVSSLDLVSEVMAVQKFVEPPANESAQEADNVGGPLVVLGRQPLAVGDIFVDNF